MSVGISWKQWGLSVRIGWIMPITQKSESKVT